MVYYMLLNKSSAKLKPNKAHNIAESELFTLTELKKYFLSGNFIKIETPKTNTVVLFGNRLPIDDTKLIRSHNGL